MARGCLRAPSPDPSRHSATATAAVLYSGQLRSLISYPGIADNHVRLFNRLFRRRDAWDSFLFADVSDGSGEMDAAQCSASSLNAALGVLSPVAVEAWAAAQDGEVPIASVAGYCAKGSNASVRRQGCLAKNETDRFNRAYAGYHRPEAVTRIMRLKHHIHRVFQLMRSHVARHRGGRQYDIVVRARPDCWFDNQHTAVSGEPFTEATPLSAGLLDALVATHILVTPREWSWGGLNDRFAIGGYREMELYANQYAHMQQGWASPAASSVPFERAQDCPGWIHAESFARCNLVRHGVTFVQVRRRPIDRRLSSSA